jgi:flagellar FliL protein
MAVRESDIDGDDEAKPKGAKAASPMKLVIVGAVALFVALVGAQVTGPLLTNMVSGHSSDTAMDDAEDDAHFEEEAIAAAPSGKIEPSFYTPLDPPFVVSFSDGAGGSRFVQLTLQAMARNEKAISAVKTHAPAIRNEFLFLLSKYEIEELATFEGKEKLRAEMLAVANDIMLKNTGNQTIAELYFTSLVIQ